MPGYSNDVKPYMFGKRKNAANNNEEEICGHSPSSGQYGTFKHRNVVTALNKYFNSLEETDLKVLGNFNRYYQGQRGLSQNGSTPDWQKLREKFFNAAKKLPADAYGAIKAFDGIKGIDYENL